MLDVLALDVDPRKSNHQKRKEGIREDFFRPVQFSEKSNLTTLFTTRPTAVQDLFSSRPLDDLLTTAFTIFIPCLVLGIYCLAQRVYLDFHLHFCLFGKSRAA